MIAPKQVNRLFSSCLFLTLFVGANVLKADVGETFKLIQDGEQLTDKAASELEKLLVRKANDRESRIKLLAYWAGRPSNTDGETVKRARARHILWIIEKSPKDDLFATNSRIAQVYLDGLWADQETFAAARILWQGHLARKSDDKSLLANAAGWLALGDTSEAERMFTRLGNTRSLSFLYIHSVLGLSAEDYKSGDPVVVDNSKRDSPFAEHAREILETTNDPALLSGAAFALSWKGGMLYADGNLDWDYSPLLRSLIERAQRENPTDVTLHALSTELPRRGERPPRIIRIGGPVMRKNLVEPRREPVYPEEARRNGIEGAVELMVLVGLEGEIAHIVVKSGPDELRQSALAAVREWRYKPTSIGGKPVFVVTAISVKYSLKSGLQLL